MSGLTGGKAGGDQASPQKSVERAHQAWEKSMIRRIDELRDAIRSCDLRQLADSTGGKFDADRMSFRYWLDMVEVRWPEIHAFTIENGEPLSTFDQAMLTYFLHEADGARMADRWIGFRELPGGAFYNQAFEGYSGRLIAQRFGENPQGLESAADRLDGTRLSQLAPQAFSFLPLPRIRLAIALWPGDEDFAARASVLFDAASSHYMTTDGLALLGAGLARRLLR